ncbi:MAG: glycosyltransferase [Desulfurococcaceae archaeon]|nr:glycosyltransferase [Desulfurococcaceae archaeon]
MREGTRRPLVTITISTYNSEATIDDVLNSLLQQDYPLKLIEVIVIDDHSIDETVNKVKRFMEEHGNKFYDFKLIVHDRNYGVSKARNDGIKHARAKYIVILDSDVVLPPNAISNMVSFLESNPDVGCVQLLLEEDMPDVITKWRYEVNFGRIREVVSCTASAMIRREVIEKAGLYDESMGPPFTVDEDLEFGARIWRAEYKCIQLGTTTGKHLGVRRDLWLANLIGRESKGSILFAYLRRLIGYLRKPHRITWLKILKSMPLKMRLRYLFYSLFIPFILILFLSFFVLLPWYITSIAIIGIAMIYIDALRDFISHYKSFYISMVLALLACTNRSIRSLAILLTFIDRSTNKQIETIFGA